MPALVLLPGLDGTGLLFSEFAAAFGTETQIIRLAYPDDPGYGYTELLEIVRASLPDSEPFFLLGESFSGPLAIAIAATAPENLQGLILCCTFARNPLSFIPLSRALVAVVPFWKRSFRLLSPILLGSFSTPQRRKALAMALAHVSAQTLKARARAAVTMDVSDSLPSIAVPTLYLQAGQDGVILPGCADLIASRLSDCRIVRFAAPHFLLQALPQATALAVCEFMAETLENQRNS